jgi:hypothetical protein
MLSSCEDLFRETVTAETGYLEMNFTVQASDLKGFQIFTEKVFANEINQVMQHAGIKEGGLQSVYLKEAEFSITSQGAYTNFNVLKFVEVTVYQDSLGEEKIAALDPIPQGMSSIYLDPVSDNLLPYFKSDSLILTAQGYLLERIYENVDLHAKVKFEISGEV